MKNRHYDLVFSKSDYAVSDRFKCRNCNQDFLSKPNAIPFATLKSNSKARETPGPLETAIPSSPHNSNAIPEQIVNHNHKPLRRAPAGY